MYGKIIIYGKPQYQPHLPTLERNSNINFPNMWERTYFTCIQSLIGILIYRKMYVLCCKDNDFIVSNMKKRCVIF